MKLLLLYNNTFLCDKFKLLLSILLIFSIITLNMNVKKAKFLAIQDEFLNLNNEYLNCGFTIKELQDIVWRKKISIMNDNNYKMYLISALIIGGLCFCCKFGLFELLLMNSLGVRCIIPNNYFIWEATRPVSDCKFCINVTEPIVLYNASQQQFSQYSYSSKPIVIKKAFLHWKAVTAFSFNFFKNLYTTIETAYKSVEDECQFLHFQSNFITLRDVFEMSQARVNQDLKQTSWYVGWGNCDPRVLSQMHMYYPKPQFLPNDYETPPKEYIFMGYDAGATMHLDFINRLMWQAQLQGTKTWHLKPSPECQSVCNSITFFVEPGDAILIDTRVWYHGTTITPGQFSLAVQSEYG